MGALLRLCFANRRQVPRGFAPLIGYEGAVIREEHEIGFPHAWVLHPMAAAVIAFLKTLAVEPPMDSG
jgi:hypothetical protein